MSTPDINDLAVAYTLCCCGDVCSRSCTICQSPTWAVQGCVKALYLNAFGESRDPVRYRVGDRVPISDIVRHVQAVGVVTQASTWEAPGPDGVVCGNHCDAWSIDDTCPRHGSRPAERFIDMMEESGYPLQPWQAQAIRAIMARQ